MAYLLIAVIVTLITSVILYFKWIYSYFTRLGCPHVPAKFLVGNFDPSQLMVNNVNNVYKQLKGSGPFGGIYIFHQPFGMPLTGDCVKQIMIKDFHHFEERGFYFNEKDEPLTANVLTIGGEKWHRLRAKLTPAFTSGKMKFMFPTILDVAKNLENCLESMIVDSNDVEVKDLLARFTTDVIGTCAFGIDCNSIKDPLAEFRTIGRKAIENQKYSPIIIFILCTNIPLFNKLGIKTTRDDVHEFFMSIVKETLDYRRTNHVKRSDFMDILMNLKIDGEESLTFNEIAAQVFLFFLAGFETSSTTLTFTIHELAANIDVQDRVRNEIDEIMKKNHNELTYECISEMEYLEQVIFESMRMHPPIANIGRQVSKKYTIPNTNITLPKGLNILIPVYSLHHDPDLYPEPERFMPERFSKTDNQIKDKCTYLPFGTGPRACIGLRFAMMTIKIGLIVLLKNYKFTKCSNTDLKYTENSFLLNPGGGTWLNLKKIN